MKYRKKLVEVQAWKVSDLLRFAEKDFKSLPKEIAEAHDKDDLLFAPEYIMVNTVEDGFYRADVDEMIMQDANGGFYVIKIEDFDLNYEQVTN